MTNHPNRSKRVLVWATHTRKWEIARKEPRVYSVKRGEWRTGPFWVRDDYSTICEIGNEVATMALPPAPQTKGD